MPAVSPELKAGFDAVIEVADGFRTVIDRNIDAAEGGLLASWEYLAIHGDMTKLLAAALSAKCVGDKAAAMERFEVYEKYVQHAEHRLYSVLDVFENLLTLRGIIESDF